MQLTKYLQLFSQLSEIAFDKNHFLVFTGEASFPIFATVLPEHDIHSILLEKVLETVFLVFGFKMEVVSIEFIAVLDDQCARNREPPSILKDVQRRPSILSL